MRSAIGKILVVMVVMGQAGFCADEPNVAAGGTREVQAAVIVCRGMIDDGLHRSIQRRTQEALSRGAEYLIYKIETYGGFVESGDNISKYFILELGDKAHTVAYVNTEAISAGAMIAVSCRDIIMRENTTIGDCAPIVMGAKLEGVEREKTESFIRAVFNRAAEANGYPKAILKAMVSIQTETYRVKNLETEQYEFYETKDLPNDANKYDLANKKEISSKDELLTLTASEAAEYGIARAVVKDVPAALDFLAKRDNVKFTGQPAVLETNWSEEMVRWLNSPAVMGVLVMLALLGVYVEFHTPGVGLAGLAALICFAIIIGSRYLTGLANWVEVAIFLLGVMLLLLEIFVIPGFGITGVTGILCILVGLFGMLIKNPPGELPWPEGAESWYLFMHGVWAVALGVTGFAVAAIVLAKYLPKVPFMRGLQLAPAAAKQGTEMEVSMTVPPENAEVAVKVGDRGEAVSVLRPAGKARFGEAILDVVAEHDFIDKGAAVEIVGVYGNRVVVRPKGAAGEKWT